MSNSMAVLNKYGICIEIVSAKSEQVALMGIKIDAIMEKGDYRMGYFEITGFTYPNKA